MYVAHDVYVALIQHSMWYLPISPRRDVVLSMAVCSSYSSFYLHRQLCWRKGRWWVVCRARLDVLDSRGGLHVDVAVLKTKRAARYYHGLLHHLFVAVYQMLAMQSLPWLLELQPLPFVLESALSFLYLCIVYILCFRSEIVDYKTQYISATSLVYR